VSEQATPSWFDPLVNAAPARPEQAAYELARQWQGFMTARLVLGVVLVALQTALYLTGTAKLAPPVDVYALGVIVAEVREHSRAHSRAPRPWARRRC
jgi:hypothetical protein